jgi:NCAIR mutase (PurE)-related protein
LDAERARRRGYPEAVFCQGKTVAQVAAIAAAVRDLDQVTLFTRAGPDHAAAILAELPGASYDTSAGMVAWPAEPPSPTGGLVVVVTAGTSDLRSTWAARRSWWWTSA